MKNYDYVAFQNFSQDSDRDRDYVPSKNSDVLSDESEIIQEIPDIGRFKKKSPKKSASEVGVVQKNSDNNQEENNDSVRLEENGIGSRSNQSSSDYRHYDKRYYCLFCERSFAKLQKHLAAKHKDEQDVQKFLNETNKNMSGDYDFHFPEPWYI